ncbi:uncharacterized protein SPPG_06801 [Spizellomyces punctatus DAOM BR117]|uniref:Ubiquitin-like domain-containing protein n=1 Tax=Spizellomyces punctatus (strain DAOM BR117) TaxID=645134 RepID=A0A0L0H9W7_SPIPD|nr:uncharacterized protein SPPG_06801 [Spizellomyces punctatus DAOM BR117]KNC97806.1 hypothetical protein SPPG_06801 [Spizellomyces punctatus DAOM BR117]|eukprot:XP_016605846.1 hypothetical protein SPPG_06801 [Spizellomyces punctatus DAOM BR117]
MPEITIKIKQANESAFSITIDAESTVLALKEKIQADGPGNVPVSQQRLIFAGKVLKDEDLLTTYKMAEGNTVHMVRGSTKTAAPSGTSTAASGTTPAASGTTEPPRSAPAGVPPFNPLAAMFGAGAAGGDAPEANPFAAFGGGQGAGAGLDPSMLSALFSNPAVSQSISQLMSNPQILESLTAANPALSSMMTPQVREMMNSQEFRQMMSDPNMMRTMMQMGPMMAAMGGMGGMGGMGQQQGASPFNMFAPQPTAGTPTGTPTSTAGTPTTAPLFNPALLQMLMGGNPNAAGLAPQDSRPPEERFATQLRQLQEMGFFDATENVRALTLTNGNVEAAVEWLFSHPPGGMR